MNKMNKKTKIRSAARKVAKGYLKTLEEGKEPAMLRAQIEMSKYDILDDINDRRLNIASTMEAVLVEAKWLIKDALQQNSYLADKLIAFRKARESKQEEENMAEQRAWKPFPIIK